MAQKKVLICDDEPQLRELIAARLCACGYAVVEASDGIECMRAIETSRPDVILLDLNMPRASGIDVLNKLAEGSAQIPIIVLSGAINSNETASVKNLRPEQFMAKPFAIRELVNKIDKICHS